MYIFIKFEHRLPREFPVLLKNGIKNFTQFSMTIFFKSLQFIDTHLLVWKYS